MVATARVQAWAAKVAAAMVSAVCGYETVGTGEREGDRGAGRAKRRKGGRQGRGPSGSQEMKGAGRAWAPSNFTLPSQKAGRTHKAGARGRAGSRESGRIGQLSRRQDGASHGGAALQVRAGVVRRELATGCGPAKPRRLPLITSRPAGDGGSALCDGSSSQARWLVGPTLQPDLPPNLLQKQAAAG